MLVRVRADLCTFRPFACNKNNKNAFIYKELILKNISDREWVYGAGTIKKNIISGKKYVSNKLLTNEKNLKILESIDTNFIFKYACINLDINLNIGMNHF